MSLWGPWGRGERFVVRARRLSAPWEAYKGHMDESKDRLAEPLLVGGEPEALREELRRVTRERDALWVLLDDIDTLDDVAKGDDKLFREHTRQLQERRHKIVEGARIQHGTTVFPNPGGVQFNREPGSGCGDG